MARVGAATRRQAPVETLAAIAARVAADAPVLGGTRARLEEIAVATGAYRRRLIGEGIAPEFADQFVAFWQSSLWGTSDGGENTEHDELEYA